MIQTITEYKILYAETATKLSEQVNAEIKTGFQPFGNICTTDTFNEKRNDYVTYLLQPMVKY